MSIYIVTFSVSLFFSFLSENEKNKSIQNVCLFIAVLIPCILAGMRDVTIGVDTSGYVKTLYDVAAKSSSIKQYYLSSFYYEWNFKPIITFDFAYTLLTYICATLFRSFGAFLFCTEAVIMIPIVAALKQINKYFNINITVSLLLFYLIYYNTTFNAVRQWLSIGFAFLAIAHLCTDKKSKRIVIYIVLSILFHKSGMLVLVLMVLYYVINEAKRKMLRVGNITYDYDKMKVLFVAFICILLLMSMTYIIVPVMSRIGLSRYVGYINGHISFSINQVIYQVPYLLILAISGHTLSKDESDDKLLKNFKLFSLCVFIVNAVFSQLATVMENSWRMVILFGLFNVLTFSFIYQNENNRSKKLLLLFILLIYGCFYWYFVYVLTGRHGTVPYISA